MTSLTRARRSMITQHAVDLTDSLVPTIECTDLSRMKRNGDSNATTGLPRIDGKRPSTRMDIAQSVVI